MKMIIAILFTTSILQAQVNVNVYYRQDGTFVQPHFRTYPDGNLYNNYSSNRIAENAFLPSTANTSLLDLSSNSANAASQRDLNAVKIESLSQEQFIYNLVKECFEEQQKEEK